MIKMKNALTIDLEDYFHVTAFADQVSADDWGRRANRLQHNTDKFLELLAARGFRATFFVLGWVAEKYPSLIRQIADTGHEIACHSYQHRVIYQMTPREFREDTCRAQELLQDASGQRVCGYRAPSFSITKESLWAFEILADLGFTYDSSVFPVKHPNYGMPDAPRFPHRVNTSRGSIVEFPMATLQLGRNRAPFGGGAYFRLLPYAYTRWGIRFLNRHEGRPVCFYLHPWEVDPDQPRLHGSVTSRVRHYLGLRGAATKIQNLLRDFDFCPLSVLVTEWTAHEGSMLEGDPAGSPA